MLKKKENNIKKFNLFFFKSKILENSSFYFDKYIISNYIYKFYFLNIFSLLVKNFYNIQNLFIYNIYLIKFLLILFLYNINNYQIKKKYINIFMLQYKLSYVKFNQIFINSYLQEFRYCNLKGSTLYFTTNIEEKLFNNLKMYTKIFLNNNQYYCLYNKMFNMLNINKYKKKQVVLNNYPILSYVDNYYSNNIVSTLSVRIKSAAMKYKYKILFSNYL